MPDLDMMLREFASFIEEELPALDPQRLVEPGTGGDRSYRQSVWRRPVTVAVAAAAAVLVVIGGGMFVLRGGVGVSDTPEPTVMTTTVATSVPEVVSEPTSVFSWGDDLSEWVTEAEMSAVLGDVVLEADPDIDAVLDAVPASDDDYWEWSFDGWNISAHNGDHGGKYVGPPAGTDPRLPQGVTYEAASGFAHGFYIFTGPNSDEMICMMLMPPGETFGYPRGSEAAAHEDMLFSVASLMLQEMGWVDPPADAAPVPTLEPEPVPTMGTRQILYGDGASGISCPEHWAHDQSLPVGSAEFRAGQGMFTVVVELTAAAPDSNYWIEVWEPENCRYGVPLLFEAPGPRVLTTDETGAGRIEFTVEDVDPGTYRLNINAAHTEWEQSFPDAEDTRLWEIAGAGFSLVEIESPVDVFSWSEGDINDWVTNDEMEVVLADLSIEYAGTGLVGQVEFDPVANIDDSDVAWMVGPADGDNHWAVHVHNGDHNSDELWSLYSELTLPKGEITTGGWGVFTARGSNSDESFCIWLQPPVEIFGARVQEDIYEEMISGVASMMLEELGWVS